MSRSQEALRLPDEFEPTFWGEAAVILLGIAIVAATVFGVALWFGGVFG